MKSSVDTGTREELIETKVSMVLNSALLEKVRTLAGKRNIKAQQVIEEALNEYLNRND